MRYRALYIGEILSWADDFKRRVGRWPHAYDGQVLGVADLTWRGVNRALREGLRGLRPGSSLALLLLQRRGRRHKNYLPSLTPEQVLRWADAFRKRTGKWPMRWSGPIPEAPGENWCSVAFALAAGKRGLAGYRSLARFLAKRRGVRNVHDLPKLSVRNILFWADDFKKRVGRWPCARDGRVLGLPDLTWCAVDQALIKGHRGLRGGQSLAKLLFERRGMRHHYFLPRHNLKQILAWADAHHDRTGKWPMPLSGTIAGVPDETWRGVDKSLRYGRRGLMGGSSLAQLLEERRGVPNHLAAPRLNPTQVLGWADAHHRRTGQWPTRWSGTIPESPRETWHAVAAAFVAGSRGLGGHGTLPRFLAKRRGVRNIQALPKLSVPKILSWADSYHRRNGRWPGHLSGPIPEAPGETWGGVHAALYKGSRGLPGGSSLYRLLLEHKRRRSRVQSRGRKVAAGR
jgi:hypothetical protein